MPCTLPYGPALPQKQGLVRARTGLPQYTTIQQRAVASYIIFLYTFTTRASIFKKFIKYFYYQHLQAASYFYYYLLFYAISLVVLLSPFGQPKNMPTIPL